MWITPLIALLLIQQIGENTIHLPTTPILVEPQDQVPQPKPDVVPSVIGQLQLDQWYVIESSVPITVLSSPEGVVNLESTTGPIKVRGKFVDGNSRTEIRTYNQPFVVFVTAEKTGSTELIIIPEGFKTSKDIVRQKLTVSGIGPNPPPDPPPDPPPTPVPPTPDPAPTPALKTFRVVFVKESGQTLNSAQSAIPAAKSIRDYLAIKTTVENGIVGWREYDPDQIVINETPTMKQLWESIKPKLLPAPCMAVEVDGKVIVMPFPANVNECLDTLKKYGGA